MLRCKSLKVDRCGSIGLGRDSPQADREHDVDRDGEDDDDDHDGDDDDG